jgi:hypothetical protein
MNILFSCDGQTIGSLWIPPFQIKTGDFICLHMPNLKLLEKEEVISILTGKKQEPAIHRYGRVEWASPATRDRTGFFHSFRKENVVDWVRRSCKLSQEAAREIVAGLDLRLDWHIAQLAMNQKTLLGLEAAFHRAPEIILFSTIGCDPLGRKKAFELVSSKLDLYAAIHLSYPFEQNGSMARICFPSSFCIPINKTESSLLTPIQSPK